MNSWKEKKQGSDNKSNSYSENHDNADKQEDDAPG